MLAASVLLVPVLFQAPAAGALRPAALRCQHRQEPLGIDARTPELSWQLEAVDPAAQQLRQTAFRVLVASDPQLLAQGQGDLWDSGEVRAATTAGVVYAGKALRSEQRCFWSVRAWDQAGQPGPWSAVARFTLGLLEPGDWQAKWIGCDAPLAQRQPTPELDGADWIWLGEATGERFFRGRVTLPEGALTGQLSATGDDAFELWINGQRAAGSDAQPEPWRRPVAVAVGALLRPGVNVVCIAARNAGSAAGVIARLAVRGPGGAAVVLPTDPGWRASATAAPGWNTPAFKDDDWQPARSLGRYGVAPWQKVDHPAPFLPPPRVLGTTFRCAQKPARATLYASALGLYEASLNGGKVGDAFFTPGWTDYTRRVYYQTYDVTAQVLAGSNELSALLADGWHSGYVGYGHRRDHYGDRTRLRLQLVLEFGDGTRQVVATDGGWRAQTGTTREADFLMGEVCDRTAGSVDLPVVVSESPAVLQAHPGEPVRVIAELRPRSVKQTGPDTWVCDLGQNIAGFARLRVQGRRGQAITLRFAERLNPDGSVYTTNLRMARCTDRYVCGGDGVETWQPRFTFHGFQYIEVTGLGAAPGPDTVVGVALSSDTPMVGSFECSEPMINQLVSNIRWTQRMNFIDVPTDCPQRDERLGWTGDAQAYIRTATCLADVQSFFHKWLLDLADAQRADGQFPQVAPLKVAGSDGGPAWADAGTICPWNIWEVYGDRALLMRQYPSMVRFVEFCRGRCQPGLLPPDKFHCFGDWLNIQDPTPNEVIFTAYFARSAAIVAQSAKVLGNEADARKYAQLADEVRVAFRRAYVEPDGQIKGHSQTGYVLALAFDLLEADGAAKAAAHLLAHLERRQWHLATGFVGTKDLMLVLDKIGRVDVAYRLLMNRTFPSWGFTIVHGATSIWERWDGWTPEKGFNDPGMNSFAHYAFGAVGPWLFERVAGIKAAQPGYGAAVMAPRPGGGLTWVKARYGSPVGEYASEWRVVGKEFQWRVTVPPNATAQISAPVAPGSKVTVDGQTRDAAEFTLGSGTWTLSCQLP